MKKKLRSFIELIIGWPLTVIALIFIIKFILPNVSMIAVSIRNINLFLLVIGMICFVLYFFIRSYFWQQLLLKKGHAVALKETTWKWGFAELRRYIPGNIWSLLGRSSNFSENKITAKEIISYAIIEAEFIVAAGALLSLFSLNFIVYGILPKFPYKSLLVFPITIVTLMFILIFLLNMKIIQFKKNLLEIRNYKLEIGNLLPHFPFQTNLKLLSIETLALFFYGLGTYFSISSLTVLYVHDISTFVGFFVWSLLVGYVSFITPMGLGVREGIMTVGLAKFIGLSLAGFASLFTRIMFIMSELVFLILASYWYKSKNTMFLKIEHGIKAHWQEIILGICIVMYIVYMTTICFLRYDNFYAGRFDLGNMDQTVWNTLHGRIFQQTDPNGTNIISRLAFHADVILVLLAPFYLLWQDPKMLLLIQTIVLGIGALFVYLIAKHVLKNKNDSLLFASLYLIYPSMNYTNLYDFHGVTLATTFLLGAFYFLQIKKYLLYALFLVLAGLTKEEVWMITAMFGFYMMRWSYRFYPSIKKYTLQKVIGAFVFLGSLFVFYYLVEIAIPHARGGTHFALAYYSDFGSSPSGILKSLIFNPQKTISTLLQPGPLSYIFKIFTPLGFVSLFSPLYLLFTLPDFAGDLLSNNSQLHEIYYQYTATITSFIFISAIYGFNFLRGKGKGVRGKYLFKKNYSLPFTLNALPLFLLFTALLSAYYLGPLPGSQNPNVTMIDSPQPNANIITNFLTGIPRRYSIAATNNLGSHLSHRQRIFTIPVGIDKADIITFLLNDPFAQPSLKAQKKIAEDMKNDKNYIEVFKQGDFIVFEKRNLYIQREPNLTHVKLIPLSIPALQHRDYIGGKITFEKKLEEKEFATTYQISYPSDGLTLYAFMEVPKESVPQNGFPVILINSLKFNEREVDYFAQHGFLVIKPDYRGVGNSEVDNTSLAPLAYSADLLNLLSSLDTLRESNAHEVFLWGQDFGGGVVLKTLEIAGDNQVGAFLQRIKGAIVWAPITTPYPNQEVYTELSKKFGTLQENPMFWQSLSPLNYIDDIKTPLEIDHGTADTLIPYTSSIELYNDLASFNKNTKLNLFPNDDHELSKYHRQVLKENLEFFKKLM